MSTDKDTLLYRDLTHQIIGACMHVHSRLGCGLPEIVYSRSVGLELEVLGLRFDRERHWEVRYNDNQVGRFYTDMIVEDKVILEFKSDERITQGHQSQLFTYLRVSGIRVGFVVNFGARRMQFKRLIL
jgi:GxxExxY protein